MRHERPESWVLEQAGMPQQIAETEKLAWVTEDSKKAILWAIGRWRFIRWPRRS